MPGFPDPETDYYAVLKRIKGVLENRQTGNAGNRDSGTTVLVCPYVNGTVGSARFHAGGMNILESGI